MSPSEKHRPRGSLDAASSPPKRTWRSSRSICPRESGRYGNARRRARRGHVATLAALGDARPPLRACTRRHMATKRSEETLACFASTGFLSDEPITSPPSFEAESGSPAQDDTRAALAGDIGAAFGALRGRPFALVVGGLALFIVLLVTVIDCSAAQSAPDLARGCSASRARRRDVLAGTGHRIQPS